jgi:hypothetical protein
MGRDRWRPSPTPVRAVVADPEPDAALRLTVYGADGAVAAVNLARELLDAASRRLK